MVMCGRAAIVWLACRVNDAEGTEPVVLKQSWQPVVEGVKSEIELPTLAGYAQRSHDASPKEKSLTSDFRKDGLCTTKVIGEVKVTIQVRNGMTLAQEPTQSSLVHSRFKELPENQPHKTPRRNRQVTRLAFDIYSLPIKLFTSLRELVRVLLHALNDYERYYLEGICHQDVGIGTILIIDNGSGESKGVLIDFDHSKFVKTPEIKTLRALMEQHRKLVQAVIDRTPVESETAADRFPPPDPLLAAAMLGIPTTRPKWPSVYDAAGGAHALVDWYCRRQEMDPMLQNKKVLTCEDLKAVITPETPIYANFLNRESKNTVQSGTPAFMSHKMLATNDCHQAIHDMESFGYVLLYLCLTRSGPGGQRHDDEDVDNLEVGSIAYRRKRACLLLFESSRTIIAKTKENIFVEGRQQIIDHVLPLFDKYFEPLRDLVVNWWDLLFEAFGTGSRGMVNPILFHYPIPSFKKLLEDTLANLREP